MKEKFNPKITIVIPVYNGSNYLEEAIQSALKQTYKNKEILVINDGSNDNGKTERIALKYINKIKYYSKENGGVSSALNLALEKMTGEYFSWLSHDDLYYEDKLEKQIEFIANNELMNKKICLFSDYSIIDENGLLIAESKKDHKELEEKPEYALLRGHINGITILIPKKAFDEFGKFDENLRCTQDYDMWAKMMTKYKFIHQPEVLAKTRIHGKRDTATNPAVVSEGDMLWIRLIEAVSDKRKAELEETKLKYYQELSKFLETTPYSGAKEHCDNKIKIIEEQLDKIIPDIKVSIIIPFYNREKETIVAIDSALNQTHDNIEIILINDGSNENIEKLEEKVKKNERIKYIKFAKNCGVSHSRNIGIKYAKGDYIAFLDSDDLFMREKIEKQLKTMVLNNAIFSHTSYMRKEKGVKTYIDTSNIKGNVFPQFISNCTIATPTVMVKREYLIDNNLQYDEEMNEGEDICFYINILKEIDVSSIKEPLTVVNTCSLSSAYNYKKQRRGLKNIIRYLLNNKETRHYNKEIYTLCHELYVLYCKDNNILTEADIYKKMSNVLTEEKEQLEKQIDTLNDQLYDLQNQLSLSQNELINLKNSTSWKITKPFRIVSLYIKRVIKKVLKYVNKKN